MKEILTVKDGKFYLNGEEFFMCSGDLHYFRVHPSQWAERLRLMKDFGLTAVQIYCPWNLHEPKRGEFDFEGMLDVGKFIDMVGEAGMKVLFRPSGYMCSEWDLGGMPAWLLKDRNVVLRSMHPSYIEPMEEYMAEICKIAVPRLSTNGGPIIAVAVENEFGSYSFDPEYMAKNTEIMRKYGIDVPLYATDGPGRSLFIAGDAPEILFHGSNLRAKQGQPVWGKNYSDELTPGEPYFITEFWAGRSMHWDDRFHHRDPKETSESFKEALELGGYVNFYMFAGGTNFGFTSGANYGTAFDGRPGNKIRYIPHTTSYDEDSPMTEYGTPSEKYYLCRDVLDEFLGKPKREWEKYDYKVQKILNVKLTEAAYMFDNLEALTDIEVDDAGVKCMEDIGQDFGFLLYSTTVPGLNAEVDMPLHIEGIHDRATVYMNGEYLATRTRDRDESDIKLKYPADGAKFDILVENMARINFGQKMQDEYKGITGHVRLQQLRLNNWKHRAMMLKDISRLDYKPITDEIAENMPVFLKGTFDAKEGIDTFVKFAGFTRGCIWINGFNLGRYWGVGPQMTLYCPGALLKEKDNVIEVLDINPTNNPTKIDLIDRQLLEMD